MKPLQGTVISNPDAPLRGHRVQIVARQRDAIPGRPGVRCEILDGPVLGAESTGLAVSDVEWDDPEAVQQWLRETPEPPISRRRGEPSWYATAIGTTTSEHDRREFLGEPFHATASGAGIGYHAGTGGQGGFGKSVPPNAANTETR